MIKVKLLFTGYLKNKYLSDTVELNYEKPVRVYTVLRDAKIPPGDVWIVKVGSSIVKEDYLLTRSSEVKLFPIIGGG